MSPFRQDVTGLIDYFYDDYVEFAMPIFERYGESRFKIVKPATNTITRELGCNLMKHSLDVEIELEHYVPLGASLDISIPKTNINIKDLGGGYTGTPIYYKQENGVTISSVTWDGADIIAKATLTSVTATDDWNNDVIKIQFASD